jgi:hypothetical protein
MLIQYSVDLPCEPKRRLGGDTLGDRLRHLTRVVSDPEPTPNDVAFARRTEFQLRPLAFHCSRCPANFAGRAFGCFGFLQCPLSEEAEEWLMNLLPDTLDARHQRADSRRVRDVRALLERIAARGIDGKRVDANRGTIGFAQGRRPVVRKYGSLLKSVRVSSSQLLQFMLLGDRLGAVDGELLCRALGVWEDAGVAEDGVVEVAFSQPLDPDDDPSIAELKDFLLAVMVAGSFEIGVRTSIHPDDTDTRPPSAPGPPARTGAATDAAND